LLRNFIIKSYTYITTNKNKTVLYVGATDDIDRRINEHKHQVYPNSFTKRYNCDILVYFEEFDVVSEAFEREKQLKSGSRKKKEEIIDGINPNWDDLGLNWHDVNFLLRGKD
jgi:putative endonuclease